MSGDDPFQTTRWSLVLAARGGPTDAARAAIAALCDAYWYPIYAYVRRRGHDPEDARDLTQEFFARLLESRALDGVDRQKGRFRAFLLAACRHVLANDRDRRQALKRGGGVAPLPLDFALDDAEGRYRREPADGLSPEALFRRRWALTLIEQALDDLRRQAERDGRLDRFEALKPALAAGADGPPYAAIASRLGITEEAVQAAVHRLRRRYREALRARILATLDDPADLDDEIRDLFAALAPPA